MSDTRKIIHVDMDAFYAAVEQRDRPELRGKPVIVGGSPDSRGVVSTCSYEAREYGARSGMSAAQAYRLCPHGIFLPPRFDAYEAESERVRGILNEYSDLVEPLSLDEAFLDVTDNKQGLPSATATARRILRQIREVTGLTASAGVSFNKFLAKVASDFHKPNGLTVITPEKADAFLAALPIRKFHGVGEKTAEIMEKMGIHNGADLRRLSLEELLKRFGRVGAYYYEIARGVDHRPVEPDRERKSLGKEVTLGRDIVDKVAMLEILAGLAADTCEELKRHRLRGRRVTLKVKFHDFQQITRSITLAHYVDDPASVMTALPVLLNKTPAGEKPARLLGVTVSGFEEGPSPDGFYQPLFPFYETMR